MTRDLLAIPSSFSCVGFVARPDRRGSMLDGASGVGRRETCGDSGGDAVGDTSGDDR